MFRQKCLALPALAIVGCGLFTLACPAGTPGAGATSMQVPPRAGFDASTGQHWRRVADSRHPASPPRLVAEGEPGQAALPVSPAHSLCIRAGHPLLLHAGDNESLIWIDAIALDDGAAGDTVRARIRLTGTVVEVTVENADLGLLATPVPFRPSPRWQR